MDEEEFKLAMEELIASMIRDAYTPSDLMIMVADSAIAAAHQVVGGARPTRVGT